MTQTYILLNSLKNWNPGAKKEMYLPIIIKNVDNRLIDFVSPKIAGLAAMAFSTYR